RQMDAQVEAHVLDVERPIAGGAERLDRRGLRPQQAGKEQQDHHSDAASHEANSPDEKPRNTRNTRKGKKRLAFCLFSVCSVCSVVYRLFSATSGLTHDGNGWPVKPAMRLFAQIRAIASRVPTVALAM